MLTVRPAQAGETIRCECGQSVTVPTMRELRGLPVADSAVDTSLGKSDANWSLSRGLLFAAGVVISLTAIGALGYYGWQRSLANQFVEKPEVEGINFDLDINTLNLDDSWKLWTTVFRDTSLAQRPTPRYLFYREVAKTYGKYMLIAGAVLLVGLALTAGSLTAGRSSSA